MRIFTKAGDLPFKQFTFPDGQRHFELLIEEREFKNATIVARIRNGNELLDVLLANDVLKANGYIVSLELLYLMGGRMDRRIDKNQPFTLQVIANILNNAGFFTLRVWDPHSNVTQQVLQALPILPLRAFRTVLQHFNPGNTIIVAPDKGAETRARNLLAAAGVQNDYLVVQGLKHRDPQTGNLTGFGVESGGVINGYNVLIVDDLCDGGGTFVGLAKELQKYEPKEINLFVTHGIFSKGGKLDGIKTIYTTDTYQDVATMPQGPIVISVRDRENE